MGALGIITGPKKKVASNKIIPFKILTEIAKLKVIILRQSGFQDGGKDPYLVNYNLLYSVINVVKFI